ncbi:chemotaxis protein CheA [Sphingomonas sp. AX6]|uniref:chemotaxis protein CheA n=1 Tax=Sphingomonas sp. AX6 TaxID=2653171 RepID=UPI0012F3D518|nr:chemotaxis protein CheW [Sphingomonas sp. AX6]VXC91778.1 Signal transduction histidine kinase CheA [Sphingomonas sp. AX6]
MDDLLQEFIAETRETLEALSGEIVAWEATPDDRGRLDAIFRFVHTVKGSCGFLDLPRLAKLSHAAEDVLAQVRDGERRPDKALVNAVLAIVDRIGEIVEAIDTGTALADSGEELLIAALAEGAAGPTPAPHAMAVAQRAPSRSVRLSVDLLDRMMGGMSDMVLARNELSRRLREHDVDPAVEAALERMSATVSDLRDTVTRTRMQKLDALFSALPRMVRDTAAELGKSVTLAVEGADVELDREMIEVMRDPLVHIIRNAIDHGLEAPEERVKAGKRPNGRLVVSARQSGNQIIIEIADDGRGIDVERVIAKLAGQGRDAKELRALPDKAKLGLIFEPGLTTKDAVTAISGRGVGMDVVRSSIDQIGGRLDMDNRPGQGLSIAIHVPLTLSIMPTIVVEVRGHHFAIARQAIEEIVSSGGDAIRIDRLGSATVATVRDRRLPLIDLAGLLDLSDGAASHGSQMLVIVNLGNGSCAIAVDGVIDNEELVIKPAAPAVMAAGIYAGQTLPDSGLPMLLLDCAGVASAAGLRFDRDIFVGEDEAEAIDEEPAVPMLLFDDLDRRRRAVPLAAIDRIEQALPEQIQRSGGRLRLSIDGELVPLFATGDTVPSGSLSVLRLSDGAIDCAYAVIEAIDIVDYRGRIVAAESDGAIAGVALIGEDPVEVIDTHWILSELSHAQRDADASPLCLIAGGDEAWARTFLRPMLERAGYRVATEARTGERPALVLATDDTIELPDMGVPVIRLASAPGAAGSIYRYDRAGLAAALKAHAVKGAA